MANEPTKRVPKTARENISLAHGTHCCLNSFYLFSPTSVSALCRICVYIHISNCVKIVTNYPCYKIIMQVKHFYTDLESCEVVTRYLLLGCRPGGDCANT
jgi:hypothetical protein